jgi:predicted dehydrogenase
MSENRVRAGVIGVGSMGRNHARIYDELPETDLVGVFDADDERAADVAADFSTTARPRDELLEAVDVVSVAVPTQFHYENARRALESDVHVLVEKPFVEDVERGRELVDVADERGLTLQVGHVERFNPAVRTLYDLVDDLEIRGISTARLGPPVDRQIDDTVVMDLMIHDVDLVLDIVGGDVVDYSVTATHDCRRANVNLEFDSEVTASLTTSRISREKVRGLTISAESCRVHVDYLDQTVEIHHSTSPPADGDVHHFGRHPDALVETLSVERTEPLRAELRSFVEAVTTGRDPVVTGEQGLRVLRLTKALDETARSDAANGGTEYMDAK